MEQIKIDNWTFTFQLEGHWVAFQPDDIDMPDDTGYNIWLQGDSIYIDEVGRHEDSAFVEVPLTIIKKLLELK